MAAKKRAALRNANKEKSETLEQNSNNSDKVFSVFIKRTSLFRELEE